MGEGDLYILSVLAPIRTAHREGGGVVGERWQLRRAGIASRFYDNSVCSAPQFHLVFSGLTAR